MSQLSTLLDLNRNNFKSTIEANTLVLVDFWADWCQPCMDFLPVLTQVAGQYPQICFAGVNVDTSPDVAAFFNVKQIPALLMIRDRIVIDAVEGFMREEELVQHIVAWQGYDVSNLSAHFDAKADRA